MGATAENDARVDARIARVLREGQDDDGLLAEDDEEDEDTRDAPSPAALTTPPQKRRNTAPPAAFAKRQTPTIHARKYAPASRALPQHPTQSPGRKLLGFEVARQYSCPGDVGGHGWTKGAVTAFHDDDEHWGETYGVSMEDDMDDDGVTFEELLLILANEADKKSVVSEQSWALALRILRMADPTQAVRQFRKQRHGPNARFTGFDTLVHPDGAECYEAKIQDANGASITSRFISQPDGAPPRHTSARQAAGVSRTGRQGVDASQLRAGDALGGARGSPHRGRDVDRGPADIAGLSGAKSVENPLVVDPDPNPDPNPDGTPASGDPASNSPESVIGTDDGVGEDERPIHEVVKRERKPARRFSTDYVLEKSRRERERSRPNRNRPSHSTPRRREMRGESTRR